jgi:nucleoside-diphosphate-sugar epimerase
MKVLVTGASGFLGSHVVDRCLAHGDSVRVLVREGSDLTYLRTLPGIEFAVGELGDDVGLNDAAADVDVVYHSAARVGERGTRADYVRDNLLGTQHLVDAARRGGVARFVLVSSPSVVGNGRDQPDLDESCPYPAKFLNHYSETKARAEQWVLAANAPGFTTCAIRPRAVWGPRDRLGYLPRLVAKLLAGRLPDLSGGRPVKTSICFCDNAADAIVRAGAASASVVGGRVYFVTDGERIDTWEFMRKLAGIFDAPPIARRVSPTTAAVMASVMDGLWRFPPLARRYPPPISRYSLSLLTLTSTYTLAAAERDLGYTPTVDLPSGLEKLRDWIDEIGGVDEYLRLVRS